MSRSAIYDRLASWPLWLAALWWGSLSALGLWVVPTLFATMPSVALAGQTAAALFSAQSIVAVVLGAGLLMASRMGATARYLAGAHRARAYVIAGMLSALLLEFAIAPRISARIDLALWHGVGSAMLLLQWICATRSFWTLARPGTESSEAVTSS